MLVNDLDGGAKVLENLAHHMDVSDVGDVGEGGHTLGHERRSHEFKGRVLCALDGNLSSDAVTALDLNDVHVPSVSARTAYWSSVTACFNRRLHQLILFS